MDLNKLSARGFLTIVLGMIILAFVSEILISHIVNFIFNLLTTAFFNSF